MTIIKPPSTQLQFILLALIPYSTPGLLLAYKPNSFFNELERLSGYKANALRTTFSRAKAKKLITTSDQRFVLSLEARQIVQPFIAQQLDGGGQLMVIFDIPLEHNQQRRQFRLLLRQLGFTLTQQSVWLSPLDYRSILVESINALKLTDYVQLYEAARIPIPRSKLYQKSKTA